MHSFGAVFAEVRVDADLGIVRVPRVVGAYGVGTRPQREDGAQPAAGRHRLGRRHGAARGDACATRATAASSTRNLAEYHVPVNADIGAIDVAFVAESDPYVNPLGAKGIGEIGITGVPAAIANAVYHATGKRVRDLPITLDKLL